MTAHYEVIYRQKDLCKTDPKVGSPQDLRPGDHLHFLIDHANHTRVINSVHKSYVWVKPVLVQAGDQVVQLRKGRKVYFRDIVSASRLMTPEEYEALLYLRANPPPPPPPKEPKGKRTRKHAPEPEAALPLPAEVPPEAPLPVKAVPAAPPKKTRLEVEVLDLWALLNDK